MKMVRKVILSLLVSFTISGSYAEETYPQDVSSFIEKRELCDHFRGEISGEPDVDNERNLNELLDQYCKGTDQVLKTLKLKYVDNKSVLEKLNTFELIECTNNCKKEATVMKHQFSDYPVTNIVRKAKGKYKANFAGHYLFTTFGCGGGSICGEIIDVNTGKSVEGLPNPYMVDGIDDIGHFMADYQLDSSLIIISGITGDTETDSNNNKLDDNIYRIRYYNFVNGELVLIEYDEIRDLY